MNNEYVMDDLGEYAAMMAAYIAAVHQVMALMES